jgi:transcription-repair coupling factor (superfamily II helicase)
MRKPQERPPEAPVDRVRPQQRIDDLAKQLRQGGTFCLRLPPVSALAHLAWSLWHEVKRPAIWITDGPRSLDAFYQDLQTLTHVSGFRSQVSAAYYPAWESLPGRGAAQPPDLTGDRLSALLQLASGKPPPVFATCVQALMQKTLDPKRLAEQSLLVAPGRDTRLDDLTALLAAAGYSFQTEVNAKGQAAIRGGIVDVWPVVAPWPARIEFFGDTVESLRSFDPASQASVGELASLLIGPAEEPADQLTSTVLAYFAGRNGGEEPILVWIDEDGIRQHAEMYDEAIREAKAGAFTVPSSSVLPGTPDTRTSLSFRLTAEADAGYEPVEALPTVAGSMLQPDIIEKTRAEYLDGVFARARDGWDVHLFFATAGSEERFRESAGAAKDVQIHVGALSEGFVAPGRKLLVLAEADLYGRRKEAPSRYGLHGEKARERKKAATQAPILGERVAEWTDIQPGDFVVHVDHGIGKYLGLFDIDFNGQNQEVLAIEYAEGAKLYLPVSQMHLLSRYVGAGKRRPDLHALGGKRWHKEKVAAEKAVQDLAAQLLETQASRDALEGHAFQPDTPWQHEFEASFPYRETPDQDQAIRDVKTDMESRRPMDRLICGDVGYGKTEVAMRAAFKAVMDGRQVALLVPTTVLAQQHYDTFVSRMAAYPVRIAMLSRFQTPGEQKQIVQRLNEGGIDIVIGTHRLLSPDVAFKELGLVIIDEEQRFGVKHKEHLKHLRKLVDILTLTATPIPRTLYMSLTGAKDLSTIQTPPVERLPIETVIAEHTDEVVREAVLRELNREGQVYFLHNRVQSIERVREKLQKLVPEARIEVAHGQMDDGALADIMHAFVRGAFDVLLCTTIIESGLDIPNVNTILIDRADRFGLAELYQLRGRVGRYKRRAYAYLLLPKHGQLFDAARKRIGAIRRYSTLGSGFKLAMRDLEIRGAGNILGAEQSGHIAAVGFDLYCQLLKRSVAAMKGQPLPPMVDVELKLDFIDLAPGSAAQDNAAVIPPAYVDDENLRLGLYRKLASASTTKEVDAVRDEMRDRFGRIPPAAQRLLHVARLRIAAASQRIHRIEVQGDKVMMSRRGDFIQPGGRFPRLAATSPDARLAELLALVGRSGKL